MSLVIEAPAVPLRTDDHGVIRVGKTRVPLDTVVFAFNQGASPEEIVMSYPTSNSMMFTQSLTTTCTTEPRLMPISANEKPKRQESNARTRSVSHKRVSAHDFLRCGECSR